MLSEQTLSFTPIHFFQIRFDVNFAKKGSLKTLSSSKRKAFELPDTSFLCNEFAFGHLAMSWNEEGVEFLLMTQMSFKEASYPEIRKGDSLELFIDTRDVKTSGYNTRFCHHFFALPNPVEGKQAGEITHFRTDDRHELASSDLFEVETTQGRSSSSLYFNIAREALFGYEPHEFNRLGLTYRINRTSGPSQHLSALSSEYQIDEQPSLWASCTLKKS